MSLARLHSFDIRTGDLQETPFASLLGLAKVLELTGALRVEREKAHKIIYFFRGIPVYCRSDLRGESLRQVSFRAGLIDNARLLEIERAMNAEGLDEDQVMIDLGIMDESTRYSHLQILTMKRILSCFQWNAGTYRFFPGEDFLETTDLFDVDTLDVIYEGISTYHGLDLAQEIQRISGMDLDTARDFAELEPFLARYIPEANVKPLLKGPVKVFQVIPQLHKDINTSLLLLYVLIITGYLSLDRQLPGDNAPLYMDDDGEGQALEEFVAEPPAEVAPREAAPEAEAQSVQSVEDDLPEIASQAALDPSQQEAALESDSTYHMTEPIRERILPQRKLRLASTPPQKAPVPPPSFKKPTLRPPDAIVPPPPREPTPPPESSAIPPPGGVMDADLMRRFKNMLKVAREGDYFEMLGVTIETDRADIKKAYFFKNQQFHVDRARSLGPEGEYISQEITNALHEAYQTLLNPDKRYYYETERFTKEQDRAWSMELRKDLARRQFRTGKWYLAQKKPEFAFWFFDGAIKLVPGDASYYAFLGWAQFASDKSKADDAKSFLKTALGINPRHPEALLFLGWIHKELGHKDTANQCFEKASKCDHPNRWARMELDKGKASTVKLDSLFGRIFKK